MKLWWVLIFCFLATEDFASSSYLKNSFLCRPWTCISNEIGIVDVPPREQLTQVVKSLLPNDEWQEVVEDVMDVCYGHNKPRMYTNTCPGQATLHCLVDQLINQCPQKYLQKTDACTPLSSLAGFKYMFSQSRYENLELNLPKEHRPKWFMKNYFNDKCCNLPNLFNATILKGCGFSTIIQYYGHVPPKTNSKSVNMTTTSFVPVSKTHTMELSDVNLNPLDCCDMSGFIDPSFTEECNFSVSWNDMHRLVIDDSRNGSDVTSPSPIYMQYPPTYYDIQMVPLSCEKEECIFKKLGIVSASGAVDAEAFARYVERATGARAEWAGPRARAATRCLRGPRARAGYDAGCDINDVLACTFDVLSENCPDMKRQPDPCKHLNSTNVQSACQINSSKYNKNRRRFCQIPLLSIEEDFSSCGAKRIGLLKYVPRRVRVTKELIRQPQVVRSWFHYKPTCKATTQSAKCLMNKMAIMNKYGFMDYFKMKGQINEFTATHQTWYSLRDLYISAFTGGSMYLDHCTSQKKLLNVIDAMLATCPVSSRRNSLQCNVFFDKIRKQPLRSNTRRHPLTDINSVARQFGQVFSPKLHNNPARLPQHFSSIRGSSTSGNSTLHKALPQITLSNLLQLVLDKPALNKNNTFFNVSIKYYDSKAPTTVHNSDRRLVLLPVYKMYGNHPTTPELP